jgi:hypothetical protein
LYPFCSSHTNIYWSSAVYNCCIPLKSSSGFEFADGPCNPSIYAGSGETLHTLLIAQNCFSHELKFYVDNS